MRTYGRIKNNTGHTECIDLKGHNLLGRITKDVKPGEDTGIYPINESKYIEFVLSGIAKQVIEKGADGEMILIAEMDLV